MRVWIAAAMLAVALIDLPFWVAAQAPPAPPSTMRPPPDWEQRPSGSDVARYYPYRAQQTGISGGAEISCKVLASGKLAECLVLSEAPLNQGFGASALKLAKFFKMRPITHTGAPTAGGTVRIPITFMIAPRRR